MFEELLCAHVPANLRSVRSTRSGGLLQSSAGIAVEILIEHETQIAPVGVLLDSPIVSVEGSDAVFI